jgi:GntR family transcriptional regulator
VTSACAGHERLGGQGGGIDQVAGSGYRPGDQVRTVGQPAGPGERLPLAKDIAAVLGVNKNTVLRALHLLRDEGLLEFRRGRGITVTGTPEHSELTTRAGELIALARKHGYTPHELIEIIHTLSTRQDSRLA